LRQEPTKEDKEFEEMVDAWLRAGMKGKGEGPASQEKDIQAEES
jgi:hypothetical protein